MKLVVSVIFLLCLTGLIQVQAQQSGLPNIVLFISDDISAADLSVYGESGILTPNLERLATQGIVCNRAYVASPSCAPSRAALMTGLMPARNGAEENHSYPKEEVPRLCNQLKELGYDVLVFGKIIHGRYRDTAAYDFDHYDPQPVNLEANLKAFFSTYEPDGPVCLMVGDRRPHVPWTDAMAYDPATVTLPPFLVDTWETREHWSRYATDITGMDHTLGEVMNIADEHLGRDHLMLFTGDHGSQWPFGKWNLYDYGIHVPLLLKWPGRWPMGGRTDAMVSWIDIFPTILDLLGESLPDSLDGKSFAPVLDDLSASHRELIFTTHSGDGRFNVYPIRSVHDGRYVYIRNLLPDHYHTNHSDINRYDGAGAYWNSWDSVAISDPGAAYLIHQYHIRPAEELYDLRHDPLQRVNLLGHPAYEDLQLQFSQLLDEWILNQNDQQTVFRDPYPIGSVLPGRD